MNLGQRLSVYQNVQNRQPTICQLSCPDIWQRPPDICLTDGVKQTYDLVFHMLLENFSGAAYNLIKLHCKLDTKAAMPSSRYKITPHDESFKRSIL